MAYLPGYSKYADLTVNGALMPGGGLAAAASGWQTVAIPADLLAACKPDLRDLRIADGTDGTTLVDYAIESIASGIVWVRPAAWSSGTTVLRAYGGHASAADAQSWADVTAGWAGVWPLNDAGPTTAVDVTGNGNNGTQSGGVTFGATGKVDGACSFDGNNDRIVVPRAASLEPTQITVAAWANLTSITPPGGTHPFLVNKRQDITGHASYTLLSLYGTNTCRFYYGNGGAETFATIDVAGLAGTYRHWCGVYDGTTGSIYIDAMKGTDGTTIAGNLGYGAYDLVIGDFQDATAKRRWFGGIDNVVIAPFAASADQVKLLATFPGHASQSWGAVQDVPGGAAVLAYYRHLLGRSA